MNFRLHPGGEGGDSTPPPDPKSAGAAWINTSAAAYPTGHHTGYNQQVNWNMWADGKTWELNEKMDTVSYSDSKYKAAVSSLLA